MNTRYAGSPHPAWNDTACFVLQCLYSFLITLRSLEPNVIYDGSGRSIEQSVCCRCGVAASILNPEAHHN